VVIWLYAAACAYIFYEWYLTGLYRLAAEWQLEQFGSYG
jgi:hypothetical protein